ncbi:unnamed protein product, partial [Protopolystoma xenopodis]
MHIDLKDQADCARVSRKGVFPSRFPLDVTAANSLQNNNLNSKNVSHDTKQPPDDLDIGSQAPSSSSYSGFCAHICSLLPYLNPNWPPLRLPQKLQPSTSSSSELPSESPSVTITELSSNTTAATVDQNPTSSEISNASSLPISMNEDSVTAGMIDD